MYECVYRARKSYLPLNLPPLKMSLEMQPIPHGISLMDHSNLPQTFCHDCSRILSSLPDYPLSLFFVLILQYQPAPTHMESTSYLAGTEEKEEGNGKQNTTKPS